jgi:hypothetical protein
MIERQGILKSEFNIGYLMMMVMMIESNTIRKEMYRVLYATKSTYQQLKIIKAK